MGFLMLLLHPIAVYYIQDTENSWKCFIPTKLAFQIHSPGGGGVLRISSDGNDRRIFLCLKFSIPGFFGVGKFENIFFGGMI